MRAAVVNQFAGRNTAITTLKALLADVRYERLRLLVAFCRGSGVGLLADDLQAFVDRGGSVETIVGLDLNGTSPDALEALCTWRLLCVRHPRRPHVSSEGSHLRWEGLGRSALWRAHWLQQLDCGWVGLELREFRNA